jgi:hypothetical protein
MGTNNKKLLRLKAGALSRTTTKLPSTPTISGESGDLSVLSYSSTAKTIKKQDVKTLLRNQELLRRRGIIHPVADPNTLLNIERLVLHLEGKGRSKNTLNK